MAPRQTSRKGTSHLIEYRIRARAVGLSTLGIPQATRALPNEAVSTLP